MAFKPPKYEDIFPNKNHSLVTPWRKTSSRRKCRNIVAYDSGKEICLKACGKKAPWSIEGELRKISYRCDGCKKQFDEHLKMIRTMEFAMAPPL